MGKLEWRRDAVRGREDGGPAAGPRELCTHVTAGPLTLALQTCVIVRPALQHKGREHTHIARPRYRKRYSIARIFYKENDNERFPNLLKCKPRNINSLNLLAQSLNRQPLMYCSRSCCDTDSLKGWHQRSVSLVDSFSGCKERVPRLADCRGGASVKLGKETLDSGRCVICWGGWLWD